MSLVFRDGELYNKDTGKCVTGQGVLDPAEFDEFLQDRKVKPVIVEQIRNPKTTSKSKNEFWNGFAFGFAVGSSVCALIHFLL